MLDVDERTKNTEDNRNEFRQSCPKAQNDVSKYDILKISEKNWK
jgi:hypothetical protein